MILRCLGPGGTGHVNLGAFGVVGRRHETYFDLSYQTSYGRWIVGFPRPAYDLVALSRITDITPRLALEDVVSVAAAPPMGP